MIKSIEVKNYKSIKEAKVEFPLVSNKIGIVGPNGVGKSNLFQIMKCIRNLVINGSRIESEFKNVSPLMIDLINYSSLETEIFYRIELIDTTTDEIYIHDLTLEIINEAESEVNSKEDNVFKIISESLTKSKNNTKSLIYKAEKGKLYKFNGSGNKEIVPLSIPKNTLILSYWDEPSVIPAKHLYNSIYFEDLNRRRIDDPVGRSDLDSLASLILKLKKEKSSKVEEFNSAMRLIIPKFKELSLFSEPREIDSNISFAVPIYTEEKLKTNLFMSSMSDGDLKTMYYLALLLLVKENSTIFIEEIENSLHPARLRELFDRLDRIARAKNLQLIFTTHSTLLIDKIGPENIILAYRKEDSEADSTKYLVLYKAEQLAKLKSLMELGKHTFSEIISYIDTE